MATSGAHVLIPGTGGDALDWVAQVDGAGTPFFIGFIAFFVWIA